MASFATSSTSELYFLSMCLDSQLLNEPGISLALLIFLSTCRIGISLSADLLLFVNLPELQRIPR